jgi:hypothetical protein
MKSILPYGESGYFSRPSHVLDPHLFDGEHLKPDVRQVLNSLLLDYLSTAYNNPKSWTMVWLAGSGVSYQWAASRGNGDLDVLFGIDYSQFVNDNPRFQWMTREEIVDTIDADLKERLWPRTAYIPFGEDMDSFIDYQYYEITFFLNDNVEADPNSIVHIRPYAAYNITTDEWTTKPSKLPQNPELLYPEEFNTQANANKEAAEALVTRYKAISNERGPLGVNNRVHKELIKSQAKSLFDSIHLGRKAAFSEHGEGYGDFYNYQWQRAKADGIVNALNEIINGE